MLGYASKVVSSLKREGVWGTVRRTQFWMSEKYCEWRLGITSDGINRIQELDIVDPDPLWHEYQATDYRSLTRALRELDIRPDRDVFLDIGSGKGRAVVIAAPRPFRRIIRGRDLSQAERNREAEYHSFPQVSKMQR